MLRSHLARFRLLSFYVYMLRCSDGSYYVGQTDDLERRLAQHQNGELGGYTSTRRPVTLVFVTEFPERSQAKDFEHKLKGWSRKKKEALIQGDWNAIHAWAKRPGRQPPATPTEERHFVGAVEPDS